MIHSNQGDSSCDDHYVQMSWKRIAACYIRFSYWYVIVWNRCWRSCVYIRHWNDLQWHQTDFYLQWRKVTTFVSCWYVMEHRKWTKARRLNHLVYFILFWSGFRQLFPGMAGEFNHLICMWVMELVHMTWATFQEWTTTTHSFEFWGSKQQPLLVLPKL